MTVAESRIARKEPLLEQIDLSSFRADACRIIDRLGVPFYCRRDLTRGELAILELAYAIEGIVRGELGKDADGDPAGNLTVEPGPIPARTPIAQNGQRSDHVQLPLIESAALPWVPPIETEAHRGCDRLKSG